MTLNTTTIPRSSLILATDLDGTFAGGTPDDRRRLQSILSALAGSTLLYVTGRCVAATRELMAEADLPLPDVLIADVGTTVVRGEAFTPVTEIEAEIERRWPGGDTVRERLKGTPGIEEQELRVPHRVSYWLREGSMDEAMRRMAERLEGLGLDLVGSAGVYIDVLPRGVNKGTTLRRVLAWLGRPGADVVVAGDTLNDLALFETGLCGVVVGNCEPQLRERVGHLDHLYLAEGEGAAGILEGLRHFGWMEEEGHGE